MLFCSNRKKINTELVHINIDNQEIIRVSSTRFLGVHIDEFVNFKYHIDHLTKKLSKYVGLSYKLRHSLPLSALLTMYKTLFELHLNYCNVIWSNTFPSYLLKLESLQKKVIRAMSWAAVNTPTHPLFRCHGLLRLTEFNLFHNACLMFEVINGLNPRLTGLLPICHPQHQHRTRNKHLITVKQRRLHCTGMSVACKGPQIWNRLDEDLKKLCSLSAFKKNLKAYLLATYL